MAWAEAEMHLRNRDMYQKSVTVHAERVVALSLIAGGEAAASLAVPFLIIPAIVTEVGASVELYKYVKAEKRAQRENVLFHKAGGNHVLR